METAFLTIVSDMASWIAENSLRASLIVVLILALQRIGRKIFSAKALYNLWLILLLHFMLPWAPASALSVHGWLRWLAAPPDAVAAAASAAEGLSTDAEGAARAPNAPGLSAPRMGLADWGRRHPLTAIWVGGMLVMGTMMGFGVWRSARRLSHPRPIHDRAILDLLEDCRKETGFRGTVLLGESPGVHGPLLVGVLRPRLLMPPGLAKQLSGEELRHVFLHEMAHLRRNDIAVAWVMGVQLVLHWFNPFVWIASHRLRVDRELACDAFVLRRARGIAPADYGRTMIHLLEQCQRPAVFPNTAGILEYKTEVRRRITMITKYQNRPRWKETLSTLACVLLGCVTLSRPVVGAETVPPVLTTVATNGNYEDKTDLPFILDGRVVGTGQSVDFVADPSDFVPGRPHWQGKLYLGELTFHPDGKTNLAFMWTNGYLLHHGAKTASRYEVLPFNGETYLAVEWKSGDYTIRHQKPKHYILRRISGEPKAMPPRLVDNINLPFVDDPLVIGRWRSVDFVTAPDQFVPGERHTARDLYLKELEFLPGGKMTPAWTKWTNGVIIHPGDKTASEYEIRELNGKTYLFMEWKSGDYTIRHMKPKYYVLQKAT